MRSVVLSAESVTRTYRGKRVLSAACLSVQEQSIMGLVGRMGAGKSTLLKVCGGVVAPESGCVEYAGIRYTRPRLPVLAASGLFYLPDRGGLVLGLTLREHFMIIQRRYACGDASGIVDVLDLTSVLDSPPEEMSGGEERRASLGIAMLRRPRCLLADDPLRGVDPLVGEQIIQCLRHMATEGCAVVITGHEFTLLSEHVDSIVWVTNGITYPLGTRAQALANPRFCKEFLARGIETPAD